MARRFVFFMWAASLALRVLAAPENAVVLNLEPTKEFPRNSEGAFVTLASGKILFLYTQFYGGARDDSAAHLVAIESADGGRTWSGPARRVIENRGAANVMSVSLLRLKSGKIALFYALKNSATDCQPVVQFSEDEAQTWSAPRTITAVTGYYVLNNDRVIQLASGRLVMPLAQHGARGADPKSAAGFEARGMARWLLSDDEGATWRETDNQFALPVAGTRTGLQEPGVVERADGSLLSWMRTDQGAQFVCESGDAGKTWSRPVIAPELRSPVSPASIKRLPGSPLLFAVWNDHSGRFPRVPGKRTPLVMGLSADGGKTWPRRALLEGEPDGWYCYTAIHFTDDAVLLGYCAGDTKVGGLNRLRIRRITLGTINAMP